MGNIQHIQYWIYPISKILSIWYYNIILYIFDIILIWYYIQRNVLGHIAAGWDSPRGNPLDCVFIVRNVGKMYYTLYLNIYVLQPIFEHIFEHILIVFSFCVTQNVLQPIFGLCVNKPVWSCFFLSQIRFQARLYVLNIYFAVFKKSKNLEF